MVFTGTITNTTMTLTQQDGVSYVSIKNQLASTGPILVTGTLGLGGLASTPLSVDAGQILTVSSGGGVISSLTITAGVGELVDIIASQ